MKTLCEVKKTRHTKGHISYYFFYRKCPESANSERQELIKRGLRDQELAGRGGRKEWRVTNGVSLGRRGVKRF